MTRPAGFTMVELALVLTILGILAWVALPSLEAYDSIRLDAAARRMAADLRYAQGRAVATRRVHGVLFEPSRGRYTVFAPTPATPAADPASPGTPLRVDFARRGEYRGVTIESASFGATPGVRFDYYGVPLDTAGAELTAPGRVVLSSHGRADTVEVSPVTGKVTVR